MMQTETSPQFLLRVNQRVFMNSAELHRRPAAAVGFLHALPRRFHDVRLYNMVLQVCASARDFDRAMQVMELADKTRLPKDVKLLTSMINGKSAGNSSALQNMLPTCTLCSP